MQKPPRRRRERLSFNGRRGDVSCRSSKKGIGEISITASGKGESEPLEDNNTPEGRDKNRRVVFSVTKLEQVPVTKA